MSTTSCHFLRSAAMNAMNCSGVIGEATAPISVRFFCVRRFENALHLGRELVDDRVRRASRREDPVPGGGVEPASVSPTVGTSGAVAALRLVTAMARTVPAFACGQASVMLSKARSM